MISIIIIFLIVYCTIQFKFVSDGLPNINLGRMKNELFSILFVENEVLKNYTSVNSQFE